MYQWLWDQVGAEAKKEVGRLLANAGKTARKLLASQWHLLSGEEIAIVNMLSVSDTVNQ